MRTSALAVATAAMIFATCAAEAQSPSAGHASPWIKTAGARVRLVSLPIANPAMEAWQAAGIEIDLDPGAKTYWRMPGETGVPTTVDFATSRGISAQSLLFPAPAAFDDGAGGVAIGYREPVILPVRYKLVPPPPAQVSSGGFFSRKVDPPAPVAPTIGVKVDFGVCVKAMCMPAQAALTMDLRGAPLETGLGDRLRAALARVPETRKLGADGAIGITALSVQRRGEEVEYTVSARLGDEIRTAALFLEAREGHVGKLRDAPIGQSGLFRIKARASAGTPLGQGRITLVTPTRAIEVPIDLDAFAR